MDEHLSGQIEIRTPSPPPIDQSKLLDKRLSHQFNVGSMLNHNGPAKDKEKDKESRYWILDSSINCKLFFLEAGLENDPQTTKPLRLQKIFPQERKKDNCKNLDQKKKRKNVYNQ